MTRKHPHLPQFHKGLNGYRGFVANPRRRAHGLFTNVKPSPAAMRKAEQRKALYMHSSARGFALADMEIAATAVAA